MSAIQQILLATKTIPPPVATVAPTVTGSTTVGNTLTLATKGTWTNSPISYTYQWQRGSVPVGSDATYTTTTSDIGSSISCLVTAINAGGKGVSRSNAKAIIGLVPACTVTPVLTPSVASVCGTIFSCSSGTWINSPTTYAYQWYNGKSGLISGAVGSMHTSTTDDRGYFIWCRVTVTNAYGYNWTESAQVSVTF